MKVGLVVERIPLRAEIPGTPLAAEDLVELSSRIDLAVFADLESGGADLIRSAGCPVAVSEKRGMVNTRSRRLVTDRSAVASAVKDRALSQGLDVLLYDEVIRADLSWYEPDLAGIPRGVVLGSGPIADQRMVLEHPVLVVSKGIEVWQSLGMLASADFVVSDASLDGFGVRGMEVPRYRWSTHRGSAESMPISSAKLIAVVALTDTRVGFASVVRDIDSEGEIPEDCLVCVIAPDVRLGAESVAALIIEGAPSRLQGQIVVVPPAEDGIAWRLLKRADLVVARRRTDAVSPAVRASTAPCIAPPPVEDSAAMLFDGPPPAVRSVGNGVEMVQVESLPSTVIGAVDAAFVRGAASVVL
ncbi:hypothetical protein HQ535_10830, partial [bacterium]|nr:hypothetical protein [bacterium]